VLHAEGSDQLLVHGLIAVLTENAEPEPDHQQ
jgi:hypothetical protein